MVGVVGWVYHIGAQRWHDWHQLPTPSTKREVVTRLTPLVHRTGVRAHSPRAVLLALLHTTAHASDGEKMANEIRKAWLRRGGCCGSTQARVMLYGIVVCMGWEQGVACPARPRAEDTNPW